MQEKIKNMIRFAIRARKYALGETIISTCSKGTAIKLVLIASDASEASKKKYCDKLTYYKINYVIYSTKNELGDLLNKNEISAFAIKDANIAKQVYKLIKEGDWYGI